MIKINVNKNIISIMEKFEVDEQLYKSQKNKKKNGYKQNYFYFILKLLHHYYMNY